MFAQEQSGYPFFDMVPEVTSIVLNGKALSAADLATANAPGNVTSYRVVRQTLPESSSNVLEVEYRLSTGVYYQKGVVRAGFFMDDLGSGGRRFWEQYAPSNLEFDHFKQIVSVKIVGASQDHVLMVNGKLAELGDNTWSVEYPDWYDTSSFYFHLFEKNRFIVRTATFQGVDKSVDLTTYAADASDADEGLALAQQVMAENEATFGPYTHDAFIAYVTPTGGGMEHCGATMTSLRALGHELTHSWFARGVMPADGNAGWIDEAVASWRDAGYPQAEPQDRSPVNLGGFSPYKRETTRDAYIEGKLLLSEFDGMWSATGGLKPILKALFADRQRTTITVRYFKSFLEGAVGQNLDAIFGRYVFGQGRRPASSNLRFPVVGPDLRSAVRPDVWHPRPYTEEELKKYR